MRHSLILNFVFLRMGNFLVISACNFEHTADLTNAQRFANGSYLYEGFIVPADQVTDYEYIQRANGERIPAIRHPRGCVCHNKICIKFCCHPTKEILSHSGKCVPLTKELHYDPYVNVVLANSSAVRLNAITDFTVLQGLPCANAYPLFPQETKEDVWNLLEDGDMFIPHYGLVLSKGDYCLSPYRTSDELWSLAAMNCPIRITISTTTRIFNLGAAMSIVFLVWTVGIYLCAPGLRNFWGKCLISCLISTIIGNLILCTIGLTEIVFPQPLCSYMGYFAYYFYESSFIWIAVIAYALWQSGNTVKSEIISVESPPNGTSKFTVKSRSYLYYSIFGWGIPLCMTTALLIMQRSNLDNAYKPGIGVEYCWVDAHIWPAFFNLYGLNAMILLLSFVLLRLSRKKHFTTDDTKPIVQENTKIETSEPNKPKKQTPFVEDRENLIRIYSLFLLVIVISWSLNVSDYLVEMLSEGHNNIMQYLSDCMNCIDGPAIFFVLVVKSNVISLWPNRKLRNSFYSRLSVPNISTGEK